MAHPLPAPTSQSPLPESLRELLARIDGKRARFATLPRAVVESLFGRLRLELTYSSNAIEGNTLSLRETQLVVEGLAPGPGKTLREIYEARNHHAAIELVERWVAESRPISARAILDLHQAVMRDIDNEWAGRLRNGPVFIRGTSHTPVNAAKVSEEFDLLVKRLNDQPSHPVLLAAENHFRFEALHPFFDGNGRTGRLLLNWQLLQAGYPITVIRVEDRGAYLEALDAGHTGNMIDLQRLVAEALERTLDLIASAG